MGYGYADVGRFGLGHGMLAWARCVVWCHHAGVPVIAPQWLRLRVGPYLRRERDKRFYAKLFGRGNQIGGFKRLWLLATSPKILAESLADARQLPAKSVRVFRNRMSGNEAVHFSEIVGQQAIVLPALIAMTRPRYRPVGNTTAHIAVHVRGGDFGAAPSVAALQAGAHNSRLPLAWFAEMLAGLRARLGSDVPAIIYSDCSDAEIADLLRMSAVARSRYAESISDMLAMSAATLCISSGSGFSRWGAYLGNVPRVAFPGQRHIRVFGPVADGAVDLEPEALTADDIPADFIADSLRRLGERP